MTLASAADYLSTLEPILTRVVATHADDVDRNARFPREAVDALAQAGLLGLVSATDVGGLGLGHRAAAEVVRRLAQHCASTALVVCMHYAAAAVIEQHGDTATRRAVATGRALATLAFSEAGSRSQFWAPVSKAAPLPDGRIRLDARKSWVTSAGVAQVLVWSSRPAAGEGLSSVWLVPGDAHGLKLAGGYDGLGLRGNTSRPMAAEGVVIPASASLGGDGQGFDVMMGTVLPYFQVMSAAISVGIMDAAVSKAAAHVGGTTFSHNGQHIADLPTVRAYVARMRTKTDLADALLATTLDALEAGAPEALLRLLEVKAAAGDLALEVTDLAMRVCGGAAFRKEVGVERHFRDSRAAAVMAPTSDALYDFIGRAACGMPLFG